jgi:hypothetical protein
MPKSGRISKKEAELILKDSDNLSEGELAAKYDRLPESIRAVIDRRGIKKAVDAAAAAKQVIKNELRESESWRRLRKEFTTDELLHFEEKYGLIMSQFKNNILPTEEIQVFDAIKLDILKGRNLEERKEAREDIRRLEKMQEVFMQKWEGKLAELSNRDREYALNLETQLQNARAAEQSRTGEFVKLLERHDKLMQQLKATRDQRIKEIETGKETFLGLLKILQQKDIAEYEGRQLGLVSMAADKEYGRLGSLHQYENGEVDRPILSADTVDMEDGN